MIAQALDSQQSPSATHGRILVVDDNADAAETLSELLGFEGYEARSANDAETALRMLASYVPDLALLDIGLPGMDGYELAHRLRADPRTAATKLIALTGYDRASSPDQAASDFDEHLVKPVVIDRLLEVLQKLLRPAA
jgi:CheY-like chemotaxis protein